MASRLLDRLKRSLFKDVHWAVTEQEAGDTQEVEEFDEDRLEAELAEEEECVTDRLGGTLSFDSAAGGGGLEESGEGEGHDSDSDFLGESMEEGLSSTDASPVGASPVGPSPSALLTWQLQESWRNMCRLDGGSPVPSGRRLMDDLLFEVTDASVMQDGSSKYVLYTIHVTQTGGSDKTPAVITRRYSDFQRLHATLRRYHSDLMDRVCFPRRDVTRRHWVRCSTPRDCNRNWAGPVTTTSRLRPRPRPPPIGSSLWWGCRAVSKKWTSWRRRGITVTTPSVC